MSLTPIPKWMQIEVLERDGWNCQCCKRRVVRWPDGKVRPDTLTFDHVIPESRGGMTTTGNLQVLCSQCNWKKGKRIIDYRPKVLCAGPRIEVGPKRPLTPPEHELLGAEAIARSDAKIARAKEKIARRYGIPVEVLA